MTDNVWDPGLDPGADIHFSFCAAVELLETREMCCRAWTADMNTQPMNFTWNLMGMMNNCVYRVKIHPSAHAAGLALRYEHPVIAGAALGGWMNRSTEQPAAVQVRGSCISFRPLGSIKIQSEHVTQTCPACLCVI